MGKSAAVLLGIVLLLPSPAGADPAVTCQELRLPVSLAEGLPADQIIVAQLCGQEPLEGRIVHVLISGATYGPLAWDFPYQPERYSYVRAMNAAGIATLNVDRLGMGRSSHPDSAEVTTPAQIFVYHQIIEALRDGEFGPFFDKVVIVGHSYGSVIAFGIGNRHPEDVDGVIITGLQHEFDSAFLREFWGNLHPANEEGGRFAGLDDGYLTTRPGQRHVFYRQETTDPKIIELDEATKETFTSADARTFPPVMGESSGIDDPVLDVNGQYDTWFCAGQPCSSATGTQSRERNWFAEDICFEQFVIPEAGHNVNLHFTSQQWFATAIEWTARMVAGSGPCRAR
jgi:pimeloyl-ACP methyl ester carboxylesterase